MQSSSRFLFALLSCLLPFAAARAQARGSSIDETLSMLARVRTFDGVSVSPDGSRVAWVETAPGGGDAIYVEELNAQGARPRRVTAGDGSAAYDEHDAVWSPDGSRLAFLSDREQ